MKEDHPICEDKGHFSTHEHSFHLEKDDLSLMIEHDNLEKSTTSRDDECN